MATDLEVKLSKRTAADVLAEIEAKLSTIDGIATADAFKLGGLVREYGNTMAGEASSGILTPILDAMMKPPKEKRDGTPPWL